MAYTVFNFKTKKALKEAIKHEHVRCYQPGLGPDLSNYSGKVSLEGPHGYHKWYAEAELINGIVIKVS